MTTRKMHAPNAGVTLSALHGVALIHGLADALAEQPREAWQSLEADEALEADQRLEAAILKLQLTRAYLDRIHWSGRPVNKLLPHAGLHLTTPNRRKPRWRKWLRALGSWFLAG